MSEKQEPQPSLEIEAIQVGLPTVLRIMHQWKAPRDAQASLLGVTPEALARWRSDGRPDRLDPETIERISLLLGIYADLQILLPNPAQADAWPTQPNQAAPFDGKTALDYMTTGSLPALVEVRRYLSDQVESRFV
jgi:hypothetical protein